MEGNPKTQTIKLMEEVGELGKAVIREDDNELCDAIGDIVVVLTSLAAMRGLTIEECINSAYSEIKNRTGKMINNDFIKDSNQRNHDAYE